MEIEEWRERVGEPIRRRRTELGIRSMRAAAHLAHMDAATWSPLEKGYRTVAGGLRVVASPERETKEAASGVLLWAPDGIDRLIRGEEPARLMEGGDSSGDGGPSLTRDLEELAELLSSASSRILRVAEQLRDDQ